MDHSARSLDLLEFPAHLPRAAARRSERLMVRPLRLALVGCADIAVRRVLPAVSRTPDVRLTVVASRSLARATAVAAFHPFGHGYPSWRSRSVRCGFGGCDRRRQQRLGELHGVCVAPYSSCKLRAQDYWWMRLAWWAGWLPDAETGRPAGLARRIGCPLWSLASLCGWVQRRSASLIPHRRIADAPAQSNRSASSPRPRTPSLA